MAEEAKVKIGSALPINTKKTIDVRGRDAISGMPKTVIVDSLEITEAMGGVISAIVATIKSVLEQTPPELAADIIDRGVVMSGGTSLLTNLDRYISNQIGVSAHVAEDPMHCVVYGCGMALENIDSWRRLLQVR